MTINFRLTLCRVHFYPFSFSENDNFFRGKLLQLAFQKKKIMFFFIRILTCLLHHIFSRENKKVKGNCTEWYFRKKEKKKKQKLNTAFFSFSFSRSLLSEIVVSLYHVHINFKITCCVRYTKAKYSH